MREAARRAYVRLTVPDKKTEILITVNLTASDFRGIFQELLQAVETLDTQGIIIDSISFHEVKEAESADNKFTHIADEIINTKK